MINKQNNKKCKIILANNIQNFSSPYSLQSKLRVDYIFQLYYETSYINIILDSLCLL